MKATPLAAIAAFFLAALCAFAPVGASAQGRDSVYAVAGVQVDETAANSAAAQQAGFAAAQRAGFERLVRRLTAPAQQEALGMPQIEAQALERLVSSVDVEQERRSSTRYIGRLTVRFDPEAVGALLRQRGFAVLDTRTSPMLVAPAAAPETPPETLALWREAWVHGGYQNELVPLAIAPESLQGPPAWPAAAPHAQAAAAASALFATLRVQGSTATASLLEIDSGARRDRGEVSARIASADAAGLASALTALAAQINARVQDEWKTRIAAGGAQRSRLSASALYSDQRQWERIKDALEAASATLISEIRIEAVGREGALVSFAFVGGREQLGAELQRRGIALQDTPQGPTLRVAPR